MKNETLNTAFDLANRHLGSGPMVSSARFCIVEANNRMKEGKSLAAVDWLARSLSYSVGINHKDYNIVKTLSEV